MIESGRLLSGTIGASFGCPFEGNTSTDVVVEIARRYEQVGVHEVMLADTIGCAVPSQVRNLISVVRAELSETIGLGCHFHNTRNTGIANAVAAVEAGAQILDSSIGGIGVAHLHREPPAISQPKIYVMCCVTWATILVSICRS